MTTATTASVATTTNTVLGAGFFGEVKLAENGWVVKTAHPHQGEWGQDELEREWENYSQLGWDTDLQGRVIPRMHPSSTGDKLILEYVPGRTLRQIAKDPRTTRYAWGQALLAASAALAAFHAAGWLHGDYHWNNVLITPQGARLIDLSFAFLPSTEEVRVKYKQKDRERMLGILEDELEGESPPWMIEMAKAVFE